MLKIKDKNETFQLLEHKDKVNTTKASGRRKGLKVEGSETGDIGYLKMTKIRPTDSQYNRGKPKDMISEMISLMH